MFSSDAQQEENFRIRSDRTDARVLSVVLLKYSNLLYPDARDEDGHRVCLQFYERVRTQGCQ